MSLFLSLSSLSAHLSLCVALSVCLSLSLPFSVGVSACVWPVCLSLLCVVCVCMYVWVYAVKELYNGLPDLLTRVAHEELQRFPGLSECNVTYLPQVGPSLPLSFTHTHTHTCPLTHTQHAHTHTHSHTHTHTHTHSLAGVSDGADKV